jgi:hypothetical protein
VKRSCLYLLLTVLLVSRVYPQAPKNTSKAVNSAPQKPKGFIDRVLDFLSISYTPGALKGPAGVPLSGQIWIANLKNNSAHLLTSSGNYRSPIFLAGSADILALRGNDIVRIPSTGGEGTKLHSVEGVLKLVGAGGSDPNQVLALLRSQSGSHPHVALLAVDTGITTELPYDPASSQDLQLVEDLQGWSRVSGENRIFVKRQTKESLSGTLEWTDVFLIAHGQQPVDVSRCDGVNCGQPSLSQDGSFLVYVKEEKPE